MICFRSAGLKATARRVARPRSARYATRATGVDFLIELEPTRVIHSSMIGGITAAVPCVSCVDKLFSAFRSLGKECAAPSIPALRAITAIVAV